jgi:hypothetical protein
MLTISASKQVKYWKIYRSSSGTPSPTPWHRQRRALTSTSKTTTTTTTKATPASSNFRGCNAFLHVSDYLLDDEPLHDDFIDRFDGYELSWP